jgi:hypothetical protein
MESNDAGVLGCLGWTIEKHLDAISDQRELRKKI